MDASQVLAKLAEQEIKKSVQVPNFQEFQPALQFDAVWACSSLLHVSTQELSLAVNLKGLIFCYTRPKKVSFLL